MPSTRGYQETLQDDEEGGLLAALKRYGAKSLEGLGRGARVVHKAIDPYELVRSDEPGGAAETAANLATSMVPGSGLVSGANTNRQAWEDIKAGNYLKGAAEYASGTFDMATDLFPPTAGLPSTAMFLGIGAKNAPLDKLAEAERMMVPDGQIGSPLAKSDKEIWKQTGWHINPVDGQPRWEIDDSQAFVDKDIANKGLSSMGYSGRAKDVLDHPELWENYPDLADTPVRLNFGTRGGAYDPVKKDIEVTGLDPYDFRSVLLHELQHGIQRTEGFGPGGNSTLFNLKDKASQQYLEGLDSQMVVSSAAEALDLSGVTDDGSFNYAGALIDKLDKMGVPRDKAVPAIAQWFQNGKPKVDNLMKEANMIDAVRANGPRLSYAKVSGEVEARNVQKRADMGVGERMNNAPWETQDIPYERQFLRVPGRLPGHIVDGGSNDYTGNWYSKDSDLPPGMGHNGGPDMQPERKLNVNGDYVGAPPGTNTPSKEQDLIGRVEELINSAPEGSGEFYSDFSKQIKDHVRDSFHARQYGTAIGDTSPQSTVDRNISKANTAMNQYTLDGQIDLRGYGNGSTAQGERLQEHLDSNTMPTSPKTGPFAHNVISEHYPQPEDPQTGVMDTWMGRGVGYPDGTGGGLKPNQVDYMNNNLMPGAYERTGTDYKTGQARAWETVRRRAGEPPQEPIDTLFERNRATTQMAAVPGPSTGAAPELLNAPLDRKRDYTDAMFGAIGDNKIARSLGLSGPTEEGFGPWQGMMEPNRVVGLQTGTKGSGADKVLDPASAKLGETMRHWYMLALGQDASGLTSAQPVKNPRIADVIGVQNGIKTDGNAQGYSQVFDFLNREFGPNWSEKIVVQPSSNGFAFKDIGAGNAALQRVAERYAQETGGSLTYAKDAAGQFDWIDWSKGEYKALLKGTLENPRLRKIFDENMPQIMGEAQAVHSNFAKQFGFKTDTMLDKFRTIVSKEGLDGLMRAVKNGTLPALAPLMMIALADNAGLMDDPTGPSSSPAASEQPFAAGTTF